MKVLITGGAGFIGSHLARTCVADGDEVQILDDFSSGSYRNLAGLEESSLELQRGSIVDLEVLQKLAAGVDVIYHLAAQPSVPLSVSEPIESHQINTTGTLNVLEAARVAAVPRVVFASSCAVYGDGDARPRRETETPRPRSPYALHKLAGEHYCQQYADLHGVGTVSLRYFNVVGPRQDPSSAYAAVVPRFAAALAAGEQPVILGDGEQTRDFVYVSDVVAATRAAAVGPPDSFGQAINIAAGRSHTILELAKLLARALGRTDLEPRFATAREGDIRHSLADIARAEKLLDWRPQVSFEDAVERTAAHYRREQGA